jgi:group I intron endonuclease
MKSGIYRITCTANGKVYVGSAQNLKKRWSQHLTDLRRGVHHSRHLQGAWNKYGEDSFAWDVLEYAEDSDLVELEQRHIDLHRSFDQEHGFNMYPTAGSPLGRSLSEQAKEKIRAANVGRKHTAETRAKMSEMRKGKKLSPEHVKALQGINIGRVHSDAMRANLSEAKKGVKLTAEHRAKIGMAGMGRKRDPESTRKQVETRLKAGGFAHSDESKAKLRAASLEWWKRRKSEAHS